MRFLRLCPKSIKSNFTLCITVQFSIFLHVFIDHKCKEKKHDLGIGTLLLRVPDFSMTYFTYPKSISRDLLGHPPNTKNSVAGDRSGRILQLLVEGHIQNAVPVSSSYLTKQPQIHLSSATIRSVLAKLEVMGYLFSPHRSAGRIPTEKAYRYYIDHVTPLPREEMRKEEKYIQKEYLKKNLAIEDILTTTANILSILTNYAALILGPPCNKLVLKHIELIDMGAEEVLCIFVTRSGKVLSSKIFLEERIPENILRSISRQLNQNFQGIELNEVYNRLQDEWEVSTDESYKMIVSTLKRNFSALSGERGVYQEGFDQLRSCISKDGLRRLEEIIEKGELAEIISCESDNRRGVHVAIAGESDERLTGISIISGNYQMGEKSIGTVNVIGPNRMPYSRIITLVEYVRKLISNMATKLSN